MQYLRYYYVPWHSNMCPSAVSVTVFVYLSIISMSILTVCMISSLVSDTDDKEQTSPPAELVYLMIVSRHSVHNFSNVILP